MPTSTRLHFDKIAGAYEKVPESWKSVYARTRIEVERVIKGKVVLDIGNGGFFPYDTTLAREVIAVDISPSMLDRISAPNVRKQIGDATDLKDLSDSSVDVILFLLSLHHINGSSIKETYELLGRVLSSAYKKLTVGGTLIIVEPTFSTVLFLLEKLAFYPAKFFLSLLNVSMVFFYHREFLRMKMAVHFDQPPECISMISLPIQGFIDPLGGTFPGLIKIPGWMSPTRYFLFEVAKV